MPTIVHTSFKKGPIVHTESRLIQDTSRLWCQTKSAVKQKQHGYVMEISHVITRPPIVSLQITLSRKKKQLYSKMARTTIKCIVKHSLCARPP
jgi:hypothetical protein